LPGKEIKIFSQGILKRPYFFQTNVRKKWLNAYYFGLFVFLFLFIFRPFGLDSLKADLLFITAGYGFTTFIVMVALNIFLLPFFPQIFNEQGWTVGKEIAWNLFNILLIGLANGLYSNLAGITPLKPFNMILIGLYTLAVGIFPVTALALARENILRNKFVSRSQKINEELERVHAVENQESLIATISSDNHKEQLELNVNDLYYITSSDNYIEVYYMQNKQLKRKVLRNTLKAISDSLQNQPGLFRCHKSYIVNLGKVKHVSGNAQGYKLQLQDVDLLIPVSRQYNDQVKILLTGHP
jgi:DNA-binding LytR/AlgR family response regulator